MPSFIRNTSGGKAISGGALAPRSRRGNSTDQVASYWSGGGLSAPATVEVLAAGGGSYGANWAFSTTGYDGGGGGNTTYNASTPVSAGVSYTITVGGQTSSSSAVLGSTVTATGTTGRTGNGNGGVGQVSAPGNAGTSGTSAASTITGVTRGHGGGGGGGVRYGAGYGANGGTAGAGGIQNGLSTGESGTRGGGGGGASDANVWGGGGGGQGGAGEVIIAYPDSFAIAATTTGSPTYSNTSRAGYHVYIFTGSGSITF